MHAGSVWPVQVMLLLLNIVNMDRLKTVEVSNAEQY